MSIQKDKPEIFSSDNFPLCVYLKTKGCKLLHISKENPRRAFFNFEENPKLQKEVENFWQNTKEVKIVKDFYQTQKELKMFLYDKSYPIKND